MTSLNTYGFQRPMYILMVTNLWINSTLAIQVAINVLLTIFLLDPSNFRTNLLYTIANMFPLNQKMIISKHRCKLWSLMMIWTELECAGAYIWWCRIWVAGMHSYVLLSSCELSTLAPMPSTLPHMRGRNPNPKVAPLGIYAPQPCTCKFSTRTPLPLTFPPCLSIPHTFPWCPALPRIVPISTRLIIEISTLSWPSCEFEAFRPHATLHWPCPTKLANPTPS